MKIKQLIFILLFFSHNYLQAQSIASDAPINPVDMKAMLGRGFDVRWAEFNTDINGYTLQQVQAFAAKGFKNVRIRTNQKIPVASTQPSEQLRLLLKSRIDDALSCNLIPILALNADDFESTYYDPNDSVKTMQGMRRDSIWWATLADWFKGYSHKLIFNINIEWSGAVKKDINTINRYYEVVTPGIRKTNPTRIIVYSPGNISDPAYLQYMKIPSSAGSYVMAEWHLYAAGPGDDGAKAWTTGTEEEKQPITDKMNLAKEWETASNIPTWVGAWMAGNANKGNSFSAAKQADFAAFMVSEFNRINSPWSINANHLYYDPDTNDWIDSMKVVLNVLSPITNPTTVTSSTNIKTNTDIYLSQHTLYCKENSTATIQIHTFTGKLIFTDRLRTRCYVLPTTLLSEGAYLITVRRKGHTDVVLKYIKD